MRKKIRHLIGENENGLTIRAVLSSRYSRHEISRLKFAGDGICLNGIRCRTDRIVSAGDILELHFPEPDAEAGNITGIQIRILYQDEDVIVVNKPAGVVCHRSHGHFDDDLGAALQSVYPELVVHPVGRLDKDVSGIMVYAASQPSAARLNRQRIDGLMHKTYQAVVRGHFEQKEGMLEYALEASGNDRKRVFGDKGKKCITRYQVMQEMTDHSLLEISIETGRTHQIRAGMAGFGHPLAGDVLYGGSTELIARPALHCVKISFLQPFTGHQITVSCELPDDMKRLLSDPVTVPEIS